MLEELEEPSMTWWTLVLAHSVVRAVACLRSIIAEQRELEVAVWTGTVRLDHTHFSSQTERQEL